MKAIRYHSYGGSDVLRYEEADNPAPGVGEVVIEVAGTSVNLLDVAIRAGILRHDAPVAFPHIPNVDVAGVIVEVGEGVQGWRAGDAIVAFLPATAPGAAAQYVAAPSGLLARAPRTVERADAAALPVVGLTAGQALFEHAQLVAGQTILINGAGGGVGGYAVQLAARSGAVVTATASPRSRDRVLAHGAQRIVDYTEAPVHDALAGEQYDIVLHLVRNSPEETERLIDLVADGGRLVSTTTPGPATPGRGISVHQVFVRSDADQLAELVRLVDAGELDIDVAARHPLTDLPRVHDEAFAGTLPGKTILTP